MRLPITVGTFLILAFFLPDSNAQEQLTQNDFNIDVVTGPLLGSSRIVGLGGAYTSLAEGIDGASWNPAAYGSRYLFELDWFEWDISFSLFKPGVFGQDDFFNNDSGVGVEQFLFINLGLRLQFGQLGLGFDSRIQQYQTSNGDEVTNIEVTEGHFGLAYGLFEGQLVVGLGGRLADLKMTTSQGADLVNFNGTGLEIGALLRVEDKPWRIGITGRLPIEAVQQTDDNGTTVTQVQGYVLPIKVYMPWEVQVGLAWQFGSRPLNRKWTQPDDPESGLERRLESLRCRRAAAQLVKEMKSEGRPLPQENLCPNLPEEPRDTVWWLKEKMLRQTEDQALEAQMEKFRQELAMKRRRACQDIPRDYWLLSAELLFIGPTPQGIGVDAFLEQERREAGKEVSIGFRLGAETEPILNLLKVRLGFYLEPPRAEPANFRPHGTASMDLRLFQWDFFEMFNPFDMRISLSGDFADGYIDMGLGIGFWH